MKSFEFERWDRGRLLINRDAGDLFRAHGLTSFDAVMSFDGYQPAKNVLAERTTMRFGLCDREGREHAFFIKRHSPPPWKEYVKPLLRLTPPIIGARNEWHALLRFHRAGIPTMVPVALGVAGRLSFLITRSLEGCVRLSDCLADPSCGGSPVTPPDKRRLVKRVAEITRTMHRAHMHHQDFYLHHLLVSANGNGRSIYVIDLGRVRSCRRLSRRWIVKDLAQLHFSAASATQADLVCFLRSYLGRSLRRSDGPFVRTILRKSAAIARHTRKHRL